MAGKPPKIDPFDAAFGREDKRQQAIEAARARRVATSAAKSARTEWFINEVSTKVKMTLKSRVRLATELVKNRVIVNISRPVTKNIRVHRSGRKWVSEVIVTDRSKPGEFPKADTTQLLKTIFSDYKEEMDDSYTGYVGTPIDYGVILELEMDRSFLVRTLRESYADITRILTGPIK